MIRRMVGLGLLPFLLAYKANSVLQLSDNNFQNVLSKNKTTLVMFYAPWCPYCRNLEPEFFKAGEIIKESKPGIALARIDCTDDGKHTCRKYNIVRYPSYKIFRGHAYSHDYSGLRNAEGISEFMMTRYGVVSKEINSVKEIKNLMKGNKKVLLGCFENPNSRTANMFFRFAKRHAKEYSFAHSTKADILGAYGETDKILLVYKTPDIAVVRRFNGLSDADLVAFARI